MKTDSDTAGDTVIIPVSVGRGETVTPGCHSHYHYLLISGVSRPGNDHLQFYLHNLAANYLDTFTYIALKSSDTKRHIKAKYSTVQYSTVQPPLPLPGALHCGHRNLGNVIIL